MLVATPNDAHLPYVLKAAECGKNVIVEKPAALSGAEAERMYAAAEKAGIVFSPHQNRRWDDDYLSVRSIYESGEIGKVYRIESRVMGSNGIPGAWRRIKSQGGGMMLDWGVHLIDQMLQFCQVAPLRRFTAIIRISPERRWTTASISRFASRTGLFTA